METNDKLELWNQMKADHIRWKIKWRNSGSELPYYEWLLNGLEKVSVENKDS